MRGVQGEGSSENIQIQDGSALRIHLPASLTCYNTITYEVHLVTHAEEGHIRYVLGGAEPPKLYNNGG